MFNEKPKIGQKVWVLDISYTVVNYVGGNILVKDDGSSFYFRLLKMGKNGTFLYDVNDKDKDETTHKYWINKSSADIDFFEYDIQRHQEEIDSLVTKTRKYEDELNGLKKELGNIISKRLSDLAQNH